MKKAAQTLPALIDGLLAEHSDWQTKAEQAIELYLDQISTSGVPRGSLRACMVDGHATHKYSHAAALRELRKKLAA